MLSKIVEISLRHRNLVMVLALALLGWGGYVATQASYDVFPEFVGAQVTIQAEAPGLSAEQVEVLVTRPIESTVNGAAALESVRSESIQGLSVVTVVFKEGTDIYIGRQSLAEKIGNPRATASRRCSRAHALSAHLIHDGFVEGGVCLR